MPYRLEMPLKTHTLAGKKEIITCTNGPGYTGLVATTWVPVGARVPILSTDHHLRGNIRVSEKIDP